MDSTTSRYKIKGVNWFRRTPKYAATLDSKREEMPKQKIPANTASVLRAVSPPAVFIAYLAGIIDADGSLSIVKDGNGFKPQASISNGCYPMLTWCANVVGLPHCICLKKKQKSTHNDNWDLKWAYNHAIAVANLVSPYLLIKLSQAHYLSAWKDVVQRNGRYTPEQLKARNQLVSSIRALNKRGVA